MRRKTFEIAIDVAGCNERVWNRLEFYSKWEEFEYRDDKFIHVIVSTITVLVEYLKEMWLILEVKIQQNVHKNS